MQDEQPLDFAQLLRLRREALGLTREALAQQVDVDVRSVGHYEQGTRRPRRRTLAELVRVLRLEGRDRLTFERAARGSPPAKLAARVDWGDAPSAAGCWGRGEEIAELEAHVADERCRVVAVLGMGGIGKTTLVAQLRSSGKVGSEFERVLWRSLTSPMDAETLLRRCVQFMSDQEPAAIPGDTDEQIALLLRCFGMRRCLLVLDNVDTLLQSGRHIGRWRAEYSAFGRLLERLGKEEHISCLVFTSREKPEQLTRLEGATPAVRSMHLAGVVARDAQEILRHRALVGTDEAWSALVGRYAGNPLALNIVANYIQILYRGDIAHFLGTGDGSAPAEFCDLIAQHFDRMWTREQHVLYWLAIERQPVRVEDLRDNMPDHPPQSEILTALAALVNRSMIEERGHASFSLQRVIMDCATERFIEQVCREVEAESPELLASHACLKAEAMDHVRDAQVRLILRPVLDRLLASHGYDGVERKLRRLLGVLRDTRPRAPGYAAANVLHLLIEMGHDLTGYDFSHLSVWQAYLQGTRLRAVDFSHCDLSRTAFTQTFGGVLCAIVSPDGARLVAGCTSDDYRVWHAGTYLPVALGRGHTDWIWSAAFSPDGHIFATGSDDHTVRLWDPVSGECRHVLEGHAGHVRSIAFSPDGGLLASGSFDRTLRLWDPATGRHVRTLEGHTNHVRSVAFSPAGDALASAGDDRTVRLWDPATGAQVKALEGHGGNVWSVAFSPDGATLASAGEDGTVRLWDAASGAPRGTLRGHSNDVWSVAFSPDGKLLASGGYDQVARLWDPATGACLRILAGHSNHIWSVAFGPDGATLVTGGEDQTVRLWDPATGDCLRTIRGYAKRARAVAFSPDGAVLASANDDGVVQLWDPAAGACLRSIEGHGAPARSVAFSPDGKVLASASADRTVRLWDPTSGAHLKTLEGHTHWVWSVAFSPDGATLASGGDDRTVRLWDPATGAHVRTLQGHTGHIRSVAFSPDDELLASGSDDGTVRLWRRSTGALARILEGHTNHVRSVAFNPDGKLLASASEDRTVRLWDPATGAQVKALEGHSGNIWSVAFSPDGKLLASAGEDRTVRLWDATSGACLRTLAGHPNHIWSAAFSPDGALLSAVGEDGLIHLWRVADGAHLDALPSDRPYERMNITGVVGISDAARESLRALGARGGR